MVDACSCSSLPSTRISAPTFQRISPSAGRTASGSSRRRVRARANVPTEGGAPVTREDLVEYMRSGCKPRDRWRIGTEHEKLGFTLADNRRMDYDKIKQVFDKLQERFGWEPMMEGDLTIGVKMDGQSVTLEPGGQFELSGAPVATLHQTCAEVNSHLYQVRGRTGAKQHAHAAGRGWEGDSPLLHGARCRGR